MNLSLNKITSGNSSFIVLFCFCITNIFLFTNCSTRDEPSEIVAEWPHAVTYEVFVRSFADGSGDGIGDIPGLTSKLDYIDELGVQALWLMPIHPSQTYHKYNVIDYRDIHPDYGTLEDFEHFLKEAHSRDIRVVIDFVVNHTSSEHPWFLEAIEDPGGHFYDFYIWETEDNINNRTVEYTGPNTNINRWREAEGTEEYFYGHFSPYMPDLNFDNQAVRDSIYDIGRFWLEMGVDGFRLDAAKHIFPDHRQDEIPAFWEEFRNKMEAVKEDVLLVGEVWAETDEVKLYLHGLPSLFNFDMANVILESVRTGEGADVANTHLEIIDAYSSITDNYVDATFLSNHDQDRVMSVLGDDYKARIAANILFTLPGAPYIYYGEEIGMIGEDSHPNVREPMLWNEMPDEKRTTWKVPEYSRDETVRPVSIQREDENSLLNHYKEMITLRNVSPALTYGDLKPLDAGNDKLTAFLRIHEDEELLVIHNLGIEQVEVQLPNSYRDFSVLIYPEEGPESTADEFILPAFSTVILKNSQDFD